MAVVRRAPARRNDRHAGTGRHRAVDVAAVVRLLKCKANPAVRTRIGQLPECPAWRQNGTVFYRPPAIDLSAPSVSPSDHKKLSRNEVHMPMKHTAILVLVVIVGCTTASVRDIDNAYLGSEAIIVDHTCTDIERIPNQWIEVAKSTFGISYGHTSHGSQIISGMYALQSKNSFYAISGNAGKNSLTVFDREPRGDLGNPDRKTWYSRTKDLLDHGWGDTNIVVWAWCGQVSNASQADIDTYLELMTALEEEYPEVIFIYMTGHLDGTGEHGNLNLRNDQIRAYCRQNNKILYDFADIESYDPDGRSFLERNANDRCDYIESGARRNWAVEWCDANPGVCTDYSCAHSMSLNCDMKARAFWWLMARLAGWRPDQ